ncbi:MAG: hypothetical protein QW776_03960 [Candidatus Nitrosocaldus sp.]
MKEVLFYDLHNLVLSGTDLFLKLLTISGFLDRLGVYHDDNKERARQQIARILHARNQTIDNILKPWNLYRHEAFNYVYNMLSAQQTLQNIYTNQDGQARVREALTNNRDELYSLWERVAHLFTYEGKTNTIKISDLTKEITTESDKGRIIIIDLSEIHVLDNILWNDETKMVVINEFLRSLNRDAQELFKAGKLINTLVIIDEAHRLAPR